MSKRKIYLASSWKNEDMIKQLAFTLKELHFQVDCFADDSNGRFVFHWTKFTGDLKDLDAKSFLEHPDTKKAFKEDVKWLNWANLTILVLPAGKSAHLEAGYTAGKGKDLIIYAPNGFVKGDFDVMYGFARKLIDNFEDLLRELYHLDDIDDILPSKEPVKENKKYFVDFYDMCDGWGGLAEYFPQDQFDDILEARKHCDSKMKKLDKNNKRCGEHYSVIDLTTGKEVYRGS